MRYPARLAHLATRAVVVAKLAPTFAEAHHLEHDEATARLNSAFSGPLLEDLLAATWQALLGGTKKLDDEGFSRRSPRASAIGRCGPGGRRRSRQISAPSSCSQIWLPAPPATPRDE